VKYESAFSDYQPFQEQKGNAWKEVNREVADNPGMGSMKDVPGKTMPGMDSKTADALMSKDGAGGHDMHSMKDMPGKTMPGMDSKTADAPKNKEGHDAMPKAKPQTSPGQPDHPQTAGITGTGVVQGIDKANGKVKLTHDPIAALGWPRMTMFFRLKDGALADQVKEGDKVEFSLEKSASGYVISGWQKGVAGHDMKQIQK
jgi:Cu/Ag efflux protein CusF